MQVQFAYWLIGALAGTAAIGIYAACMSVASLANPLLTGIYKPMLAHSALAIKHGGRRQLLRATVRDTLLIGAPMAVFCAVILAAGEKILYLLFASKDYAGNYWSVVILAFWHLEQAIAMPATNALAVMGLARTNFHLGLVSTILSTLIVLSLAAPWGPLGAAIGLLVGTAAGCVLRWIAVVRAVRAPAAAADLSGDGA
jgi:O-antigen/teichoic acid export membrane protein